MTTMATIQIHEYATGWTSDHGAPGSVGVFGLPNRVRRASATVVIGFHDATVRSGPGIDEIGTNLEATKVNGNSATNAIPPTPYGVATRLPNSTPIQIMANANATIRA